MGQERADVGVVALEGLQDVLALAGIPDHRGERQDQVGQRPVSLPGQPGLAGPRDGAAVCVDRQHAADRDVTGGRHGAQAVPRGGQRRGQVVHGGARLHGDRGRRARGGGDRGQVLGGVEQHIARPGIPGGQHDRRPAMTHALGPQPVAVGLGPVGQRDHVGRGRGGRRPDVVDRDHAGPVGVGLLVQRDGGRESGGCGAGGLRAGRADPEGRKPGEGPGCGGTGQERAS